MASTVRKLLWERENLLATFNLTLEVWVKLVKINRKLATLTGKGW